MSWLRYDDRFNQMDEVGALSDRAFRLYHNLVESVGRNERTDGFVPAHAVERTLRVLQATKKHLKEIEAQGLSQAADGGLLLTMFAQMHGKPQPKDPTSAKRQKEYRDRHKEGPGAGDLFADGEPLEQAKEPLHNGNSNTLRNGESDAVTSRNGNGPHARDPTRPDLTRPVTPPPGVSTPDRLTDGGCGGGEYPDPGSAAGQSVSQSSPKGLGEGESRISPQEAREYVETALAEHPHWRAPLDELQRKVNPVSPPFWRASVIRNWQAGDGTPEPPKPERPKAQPRPAEDVTRATADHEAATMAARAAGESKLAAIREQIAEAITSPPDEIKSAIRESIAAARRNATQSRTATAEQREREAAAVDAVTARLQTENGAEWRDIVTLVEPLMPEGLDRESEGYRATFESQAKRAVREKLRSGALPWPDLQTEDAQEEMAVTA